jgi:hypothetical protein
LEFAIARRYQRGFDVNDRGIQADIAELALNASRLLAAENQGFTLSCPSGAWVGASETISLANGPDQRLLYVRSFLSDQQEHDI